MSSPSSSPSSKPLVSPGTVIFAIFSLTALLPAFTMIGRQTIIPGIVLAVIIQTIALSLYLKWLDKNYKALVPDFIGIVASLFFAIILGGLSISYGKYLSTNSFGTGVLWGGIGALITLLIQSFSIKVSGKIN